MAGVKHPIISYDLKSMAQYIEDHKPGLIITGAAKYAGRQILEGDDGKLYVLRNLAGWDEFDNIIDAMNAIRNKPSSTYPVLPKSKAWDNPEEQYYNRRR